MQPNAAATNLVCLANAFAALLLSPTGGEDAQGDAAPDGGPPLATDQAAVVVALKASIDGYSEAFRTRHAENCQAKLGLGAWDEGAQGLWDELLTLMATSSGQRGDGQSGGGVDFTLFFRNLGSLAVPRGQQRSSTPAKGAESAGAADGATDGAADGAVVVGGESLEALLQPAALEDVALWREEHRSAWSAWAQRYWGRVLTEGRADDERRSEMNAANPKFVLRNWMAKAGYEAADRGDYSTVRELHAVLTRPYDEQSDAMSAKYAQVTPEWARGKMGLESMS